MKSIIFLIVGAFVGSALAGPEVPWPIDKQRDVIVEDLQGTWLSKNLTSPRRILEIKVQETDFNISCPYVVTVTTLSPFTGNVEAKDMDVICASQQRTVVFVLSDETGQPKQQIEIVGLFKDKKDPELGKQYLGVTAFNYGETQEIIYRDVFYKSAP